MTTAVKAIYEDGVFKPLEPLQLDELTQVEVLIPCPPATDSRGQGRCYGRSLLTGGYRRSGRRTFSYLVPIGLPTAAQELLCKLGVPLDLLVESGLFAQLQDG